MVEWSIEPTLLIAQMRDQKCKEAGNLTEMVQRWLD